MRHFTTEENNRLILMKEYVDDVQSYPGLSNEDLCAKMRLIEHFAAKFQETYKLISNERVATQNAEVNNNGNTTGS